MKVTAWDVENAKPGDDAPEVPLDWPRNCLACLHHATSQKKITEAFGMVIADWGPWTGMWVPMCAEGVANHRRSRKPVAVPAMIEEGVHGARHGV